MDQSLDDIGKPIELNTAGGASIGHDVNAGGNFVGRDKRVNGHEVRGDVITINHARPKDYFIIFILIVTLATFIVLMIFVGMRLIIRHAEATPLGTEIVPLPSAGKAEIVTQGSRISLTMPTTPDPESTLMETPVASLPSVDRQGIATAKSTVSSVITTMPISQPKLTATPTSTPNITNEPMPIIPTFAKLPVVIKCTVGAWTGVIARNGPGFTYEPLFGLEPGEHLRALSRREDEIVKWIEVVQSQGNRGWVDRRYLDCEGDLDRLYEAS